MEFTMRRVEDWLKKLGPLRTRAPCTQSETQEGLRHAAETEHDPFADIKPDKSSNARTHVSKSRPGSREDTRKTPLSDPRPRRGAALPSNMGGREQAARECQSSFTSHPIFDGIGVMLYVFLRGKPPFTWWPTLVEVHRRQGEGVYDPIRTQSEVPNEDRSYRPANEAKDLKYR